MFENFGSFIKSWQISAVSKTAASLFPFSIVAFLIITVKGFIEQALRNSFAFQGLS
jgi:hypothetical protein